MSNKYIEFLKVAGNAAAIGCFMILVVLAVAFYVVTHTDDADIFPSPVVYLDAQANARGNLFYPPANGEAFCLGDELLWEKNNAFGRSTRVQRFYYLQLERPFRFVGPQAEALTERYGTDILRTVTLHSSSAPSTHVSEGFFDGGLQSYRLPTAEELRPHHGIKPGDHLRLYVDVEAPFSQSTGYYVPLVIGEHCPVVEPTARQGLGELGPLWAQR
jgi:hypothetical protein